MQTVLITAAVIFGAAILIAAAFVIANVIVHAGQFGRTDASRYTENLPSFNKLDTARYPYERLPVMSGKNRLGALIFGRAPAKGIVVISCGHQCRMENYIDSMRFFVDHRWRVVLYDYTGCYTSGGKCFGGYVQAPADLEAVISFLQNDGRYRNYPICLYGHSLGAYASAAVLQCSKYIKAAVAASGFDNPAQQWDYSVRRFTGVLGKLMSPFTRLFMRVKFGEKAHFTAIDGINASKIPVLVYQGSNDEFYGHETSIYARRDLITNPLCVIKYMDKPGRNGHYDYLDAGVYGDISAFMGNGLEG